MDVTWEEAVWSSRIRRSRSQKGLKAVRSSLPKTGQADVDEEVGTAAGDEEDTKGGDCGVG